jgi:hypothetical protein
MSTVAILVILEPFPRTCQTCGKGEAFVGEFGGASIVKYCPDCAQTNGTACSACGFDSGNGAGGYSNCCGAPLVGVLEQDKEVRDGTS